MTFRRRSSFVAAAALVVLAVAAQAQSVPGVGYEPGARGFRTSGYKLDSVASSYTYYTMDLNADPGAAGARPNPYYIDASQPAVYAAFEQRYGAGTLGPRMKAWQGPNNEVRPIIAESLRWWFANRPALLGGSQAGRNGLPTEREITDVQATGDRDIWQAYLVATTAGFSPDNREIINDPSLPPGDGQRTNSFWNMMTYYHNTYMGYYPFSPQVAVPAQP
jgi:hypothetical protein